MALILKQSNYTLRKLGGYSNASRLTEEEKLIEKLLDR